MPSQPYYRDDLRSCPKCVYLYTQHSTSEIYDFYYCYQHGHYTHPCLLRRYDESLYDIKSIVLSGSPTACDKDILPYYYTAAHIASEMNLITKCEMDMIYNVKWV